MASNERGESRLTLHFTSTRSNAFTSQNVSTYCDCAVR